MIEAWRAARGVLRSMRIYNADRTHAAAMDRLYGGFIRRGDLAFDVGAHVGDRVACFRRLGARVIAIEPQPALAMSLRVRFGFRPGITIERAAVACAPGDIELMVNVDNPTVSTASKDFIRAAEDASGWREQRWTKSIRVRATTLDALIARYGEPSFIKIDVEGFEAQALAGLTRPVAALSFEFTTIQRDVALAALFRCEALGYKRFNAALGESQTLVHPEWVAARTLKQWFLALPYAANSGDVYARLA
ncbi:FkbM family methyltransferase [Bradyrhizobium sp. LHD-71]|uniref:FkbM family methyltransferase n=1 Tax=Bradyrhizobium sp. LHD-71 TaxID=3072141 RepID=UPI002810016A|nr:FkbM family methyltransferase [Bradyrhizobium sp. LHD-71]MDQ8730270.1 FkbM family methyltransferase [Bradyrhizobium sp. LHD-71]